MGRDKYCVWEHLYNLFKPTEKTSAKLVGYIINIHKIMAS